MLKCGLTGATGVLGGAIKKQLGYKFISFKGRIENKKNVSKWIKENNFDLIIHLAAIVPTTTVNNNFYVANKINYGGTKNIVDSILKYKPNLKWFFFPSSSHVYKISKKFKKINEKQKLVPSTRYGDTKLRAENYIIKKLKKSKIKYCIGRIFSFSSINQKPSYLIPSIIIKIKIIRNQIIFFKDLNHYRDFLPPEEICRAIDILRKYSATGIYNICSGKALLLKEIANHIAKKYNKECKFEDGKRTFLIGDGKKINKLGFIYNRNYYNYLDYIIQNNKS